MTAAMTKDELLREFAAAYERLIAAARESEQRGDSASGGQWGPRETVAHLAGWEVMASVRLPAIVAGMTPMEFADEAQDAVMTDAINATIVAMAGDQPLDALCGILRREYERDLALLRTLEERHFQPGEYVYERTAGVIEHCDEHIEKLG